MFSFLNKLKVRTRFAPSPTGYLHVGGLRTALYAYIFAKQNKGSFVLRIEDTDQTREVPGAVENLLKNLAWASLKPDEGVILDKAGKAVEKGHFGPYTQSKRLEIYQKYASELVNKGLAYYCFCSEERLENLRRQQEAAKQPTRYDWHCRHLLPDEVQNKLAAGEKYTIRMKVPENQEVVFNDLIRGEIKFRSREIDDQVILKADGFPTYHLASVVDDHLMKISHVIRGEEWLSSTPKHLLLYKFLGWTPPLFAHLPLILNADRSKLSKRQGDVAVEDYRDKGYLPEALLNFVALLGWNPGTEQEIFLLPELIQAFSLAKVHKAGAIFDLAKLDWLNGEYLKKLTNTKFAQLAKPYLEKNVGQMPTDLDLEKILKLEQERVSRLNEVGGRINFFFTAELSYNPSLLVWKKSSAEAAKKNLQLTLQELEKYSASDWERGVLENKLKTFITKNNLTNGEVLWPMRVALTGMEKSPTPFEVAEILGPEKSLLRIRQALERLKTEKA
ncbi:MAG: glutamate--tRNA ligase [Patescibacteria group bacterium]